jgi:hypothetical protein
MGDRAWGIGRNFIQVMEGDSDINWAWGIGHGALAGVRSRKLKMMIG